VITGILGLPYKAARKALAVVEFQNAEDSGSTGLPWRSTRLCFCCLLQLQSAETTQENCRAGWTNRIGTERTGA